MTPSQARDRACDLAVADHDAALKAARGVGDPWFACQALAWVARFATEDRVVPIAEEAFKIGRKSDEPYKVVGSAAWPVRALVERGHEECLGPNIKKLLELTPNIEPRASRSEALFHVFQAVFIAGRLWWEGIFWELARTSEPAEHWRQARNLRDAVLMVASEDLDLAHDICRSLRDDRMRGQIERNLARSAYRSPRQFFWSRVG